MRTAVTVPVTLKIRTGWDHEHKNGVTIARIAEDSGIDALAVHGRTRADRYNGDAEYDTIALIKRSVSIPVFANGDIDSPLKAQQVLKHTAADGLLIGRAAQGRPWIFNEINHFLKTGEHLPAIGLAMLEQVLLSILSSYTNFTDNQWVYVLLKHTHWYLAKLPKAQQFRTTFNQLDCENGQKDQIQMFFNHLRALGLKDAA